MVLSANKRKLRKRRFHFLLIAVVTLAFVGILNGALFYLARGVIVDEQGSNAANLAAATARLIEQDSAAYARLTADLSQPPSGENRVYYERMLDVLRQLRQNTDVNFIFTEVRISDSQTAYVLDGEPPDSKDFSPFGSVDSLGAVERDSFDQRKILYTGVIDDPVWGHYLTGYAPIMQTDGSMLGLVGVDISLSKINTLILYLRFGHGLSILFMSAGSLIVIYKLLERRYRAQDYDRLTNLFSRSYHDDYVGELIKTTRQNKRPFSFLVLDIDNFKHINDQYGHAVGDRVLRLVAQLINMNTRTEDVCVRYGGDEFIIIMPNTTDIEAQKIAERLQKSMSSTPIPVDDTLLQITLSAGIAQWRCNADAQDLLESADQAMYQSKADGRNRITVASNHPQASAS